MVYEGIQLSRFSAHVTNDNDKNELKNVKFLVIATVLQPLSTLVDAASLKPCGMCSRAAFALQSSRVCFILCST